MGAADMVGSRPQSSFQKVPIPIHKFDPRHHQFYHGRLSSNITSHLKQVIPSHSLNPLNTHHIIAHHKKKSSISHWTEPDPKHQRPVTAPLQYFGRRPTSVTGLNRRNPSGQADRPAPSPDTLPYFGKQSTYVTDPSKYKHDRHFSILSHCLSDTPSTTPAANPPNSTAPLHVNSIPHTTTNVIATQHGSVCSTPRAQYHSARSISSDRGNNKAKVAPALEDDVTNMNNNRNFSAQYPATPWTARAYKPSVSGSGKVSCPSKKSCFGSTTLTRGAVSCPSTPRVRPQKHSPGDSSTNEVLRSAADQLQATKMPETRSCGKHCDRSKKKKKNSDGSSRASTASCSSSGSSDSLVPERAEYVSNWAGQLHAWARDFHNETPATPNIPSGSAHVIRLPDFSRRSTSITRHCIF